MDIIEVLLVHNGAEDATLSLFNSPLLTVSLATDLMAISTLYDKKY